MNRAMISSSTPESAALSAGMFLRAQTIATTRCCDCGQPIDPNPANSCARCLNRRIDITASVPTRASLDHCIECKSWLQHPRTWIRADLESPELLAHCLRRLKPRLRDVVIRYAEFIWTEPHSKRVRVRLVLTRETLPGAVLEKTHEVEFIQHDRLCDRCSRAQASPDQWVANVQLRQHVPHRRTFLFLEQLILLHGAAVRAIRIKEEPRGLDFFFGHPSHAQAFIHFVSALVPTRVHSGKQLVSHDPKSNLHHYKYTFSLEICPICREDLICLPKKLAASLGNIGPLVLCAKISTSILLLDPFTLRFKYLTPDQFWHSVFRPLLTSRQLVEYVVLHVKERSPVVRIGGFNYSLARVEVARVSDLGTNDMMFDIQTHLGHLLNEGDVVLGYDLYAANINDSEVDKYKDLVLPDAILLKKKNEDKKHRKLRLRKLKRLDMEVDGTAKAEEKRNTEYEEFLRDLEENPESVFDLSLYRNKYRKTAEVQSSVGDDSVELEQLLADLELKDDDDDDDEEEDGGMEE